MGILKDKLESRIAEVDLRSAQTSKGLNEQLARLDKEKTELGTALKLLSPEAEKSLEFLISAGILIVTRS